VTAGCSPALFTIASLALGACATMVDPPPRKQADIHPNFAKCYGLNADFYFIAERYERPWLSNSSVPFNFANLFHFGLRNDVERNVRYARLQVDPASPEVRIVFSSSTDEVLYRRTLENSHVDCSDDRTVVRYMHSIHGADSLGGSERTITVTFKPTDGLAHATSRLEGVSRSTLFFMFPVPMNPVETWAQFRQSR
jgi:hypothetical protein